MLEYICYRSDVVVRLGFWIGIGLLLLFNLANFNSYQLKQESEKLFRREGKTAVLYAAPTFHDEVVSSVACTIKDEGYFVIAYIGSGLHWGKLTLPFSNKRQRASDSFYGKCVDRWISITEPIADYLLVDDPDLLIFVTYPMLKHNFVHDGEALQILRHLHEKSSSTNVVLVTHRSNEALHETLPKVEALIPRDQLTFMFLGEHTQTSTEDIMKKSGHVVAHVGPGKRAAPEGAYRVAHFYPIIQMGYLGTTRDPLEARIRDWWANFWYPDLPDLSLDGFKMQSFAIQGNFGGKHAHRKDVKGTVECLQRIESSYQEDPHIANIPLKAGEPMDTKKTPLRVSLELIGHLNGDLPLPPLQFGFIRFLSDLIPVDYYRTIARSRFMIAAVGDEYLTSRATSSVPAALSTTLPLVTSKKFLNIYPCLREARVHLQIARDTECEAIAAAARLSEEEYGEAKKEVARCAHNMYGQGRELFAWLGSEARERRRSRVRRHKTGGAI